MRKTNLKNDHRNKPTIPEVMLSVNMMGMEKKAI
jgi:hypothetical protein